VIYRAAAVLRWRVSASLRRRSKPSVLVQPGYSVSEVQPATFLTPKRPTDLAAKDPWPNSDTGALDGGYWPLADAFLKVFIHKNDPDFFTRSLISFEAGGPGTVTGYPIVVPGAEVVSAAALADLLQTMLTRGISRPELTRFYAVLQSESLDATHPG
jgi:hypothetical protein